MDTNNTKIDFRTFEGKRLIQSIHRMLSLRRGNKKWSKIGLVKIGELLKMVDYIDEHQN